MFNKFIFFLAVSSFFLFGTSKVFASDDDGDEGFKRGLLHSEFFLLLREDTVEWYAENLATPPPPNVQMYFLEDPFFKKHQGNAAQLQQAFYLKLHRDLSFIVKEKRPLGDNPSEEEKKQLLKKFDTFICSCYMYGEDPRFLYGESDEDDDCYNPTKGKTRLFLRGDNPSLDRKKAFTQDPLALGHQHQEEEEEPAPSNATQARLRKKLQQRQKQAQTKHQPKEEEQGAVGGVTQTAPFTWSDFEEEEEKEKAGKKKKKKKKNKKDKPGDEQKGREKKDKDSNEDSDNDEGKGDGKPAAAVKLDPGARPKEKSVQPPPPTSRSGNKKEKKKEKTPTPP